MTTAIRNALQNAKAAYFAWADWRQRAVARFMRRHIGGRPGGLTVEIEGGDFAQWWRILRLDPAAVVVLSRDLGSAPSQRNGGVARVLGSSERVPLRAGAADVLLCSEVLEHCEEPRLAFSEAARLLCHGGLLLVTAPNGDMALSHRFPILGRARFEELERRSGHISKIRRSDVARWAVEAGLTSAGHSFFHRTPLGVMWWELFTWFGLKGRRELRALAQMFWPVVGLADVCFSRQEGLWMGLVFVRR